MTVIVGISIISGIFIAVDNPFKSSGPSDSKNVPVTPVPTVAPAPTPAPTPTPTVPPGPPCNWRTCQNGGTCTNGRCKCTMGWKGTDCTTSKCPPCSTNQQCNDDGVCGCILGWTGTDCSIRVCQDCVLANGTCLTNGTCSCNPGWLGPNCDQCLNCEPGRGDCQADGTCVCNKYWTGDSCTTPVCDNCSSGGICTEPNICTCNAGWTGYGCRYGTPQCEMSGTPITADTPGCYCGAGESMCTVSTVTGATRTTCSKEAVFLRINYKI